MPGLVFLYKLLKCKICIISWGRMRGVLIVPMLANEIVNILLKLWIFHILPR